MALKLWRGGPALENTPSMAQTTLKEVNLLEQPQHLFGINPKSVAKAIHHIIAAGPASIVFALIMSRSRLAM